MHLTAVHPSLNATAANKFRKFLREHACPRPVSGRGGADARRDDARRGAEVLAMLDFLDRARAEIVHAATRAG